MQENVRRGLTIGGLTVLAVAVEGYHPNAEDGGLYTAGIEKLLNPALFPAFTPFVTEHLRFSLFAPIVAGIVRLSHVPLAWVLLTVYLASTAAMLAAGMMLARRAGAGRRGELGAAALMACWLGLPVAGTSLMLMDPYVTARSLSTPLVLAAVAWGLDAGRGERAAWLAAAGALLLAGCVHPLMAGYGLAAVLLAMWSARGRPRWLPWLMAACAIGAAGLLQWRVPAESADSIRVAASRYYWFLSRWRWYEQFGLVAPLVLVAALAGRERKPLARSLLLLGAIALVVAVLFTRTGLAAYPVARLQPLRCFQVVYAGMIVLLGTWAGERLPQGRPWRWALAMAALAGILFFFQRQTYPATVHFEWPGRATRNPWVNAFEWARQNTPVDAVFALDAHYITRAGEDAQCFRAIAQRSAPADFSKDGGEASIAPSLIPLWIAEQATQLDLEDESDATRLQKLRGVNAGWVVLSTSSTTAWRCPYNRDGVKVCRVPR